MQDQQRLPPGQPAPIKLYGTAFCGDCRMAKRWFDQHGISYESINIEQDERAATYVQQVNGGMRSVPTILFPDGSLLVEPTVRELAAKCASTVQPPVNTALHDPSLSSMEEQVVPHQQRKQVTMMNTTMVRLLIVGAIAGMVAGAMMAMYAMIASATFLSQGFFTPLYGIASPLLGPSAMMQSMKQGIYLAAGPALLGLLIHMLWSALYGMIFALIAWATHLRGMLALMGGLVYGLVVLVVMSFIVLPIVGAGTMPAMIGWPSFVVEHLIFGMVLGLWPLLRPADVPRLATRPA